MATKKTTAPKKKPAPRKLIAADEPAAVSVFNAGGKGDGVIVCDHASNRVPRSLKDLGLKKADLRRHIAWDTGAADIAHYIARRLDMPAVLSEYSRLIIDVNRGLSHPECIPSQSDGTVVSGNASLTKKEAEQRFKEIYWPYQNKVGQVTDKILRRKKIPFIISVHSMTDQLQGESRRPWHIALLWKKEEALAKRVVSLIRKKHPELLVGENQPYSLFHGRHEGSTIWRHAEERGLPYILVEFRQDLIDTKTKATQWADIFLEALQTVLDDPATFAGRKIKPYKK